MIHIALIDYKCGYYMMVPTRPCMTDHQDDDLSIPQDHLLFKNMIVCCRQRNCCCCAGDRRWQHTGDSRGLRQVCHIIDSRRRDSTCSGRHCPESAESNRVLDLRGGSTRMAPTASERRANKFKGLHHFHLKIWPGQNLAWLKNCLEGFTCNIRSTAERRVP